jgi:hypothetical protein
VRKIYPLPVLGPSALRRLTPVLLLLMSLVACRPGASEVPAVEPTEPTEQARWSYVIRLAEDLRSMDLALCIEGPPPRRLTASREAIEFVSAARVRGGPPLARDGRGLRVETLGEHGCVDLEIDLEAAAAGSWRGTARTEHAIAVSPRRWLWHPSSIPAQFEARVRFELPTGVSATVPWPTLDLDDAQAGAQGWRLLERSAFGWSAWVAFGRFSPLRFEAAACEFEVAILGDERAASDAGLERWLRLAAETSAELYGRFPRERVAVLVIPISSWGGSPVPFGMARRGGGGSVMLLLDEHAEDDALVGEWVAVHELLHLGMPLIADPWMSEGFVTYYTQVLRARRGLLDRSASDQAQVALGILASGFAGGPHPNTLVAASARMRELGSYRQVYWGGAAIAFELDLSLRRATQNRRSLDDLMRMLHTLAPEFRRYAAVDLVARMEAEVERWRREGVLDAEISPSAIVLRHLGARSIPAEIQQLHGVAVELESIGSSHVGLLDDPLDEVQIRSGLFAGGRRD